VERELLSWFAILACVVFVSALANRINKSTVIMLLLAGLMVGLTPLLSGVEIRPHMVMALLLPPILYSAGVDMSWRGLRDNAWTISFLAVGCVVFSAAGVAVLLNVLFGTGWAAGLLLGAIIAPPDSVAPIAIARRFLVPSRLLTIIEGEGLVNDATALVLVGLASAAIHGGSIDPVASISRYIITVAGEVGWGISTALITLRLRRWAGDTHVEIALSLLTPYVAFWVPGALGGSGVLAAVVAGLFVSWNGHRFIAASTRIQGYFTWDFVTYIIEGLAFFLAGLQVHQIVASATFATWRYYLLVSIAIGIAAVLLRFAWVFFAIYLPKVAATRLGVRTHADWKYAVVISSTGVRGVVSLLAALSVPVFADHQVADYRSLILVVTLCVTLFSMFASDLLLPRLIIGLGLDREGEEELVLNRKSEVLARVAGVEAVLTSVAAIDGTIWPDDLISELRRRHESRVAYYRRLAEKTDSESVLPDILDLELELLDVEREHIAHLFAAEELDDEARRRIERELDLEDTRIRHCRRTQT
jgi:CPA1 family monovalent cation:H+ antiporter